MVKLRRTKKDLELSLGHNGIAIINALTGETDRGCALVAAEFVSDAIERYLRALMQMRGASEQEIKDFAVNLNAPLGNLSPRLKALFWFGLIGPKTYRALENLREIRNHCAHRAGPIDLKDSELEPYVRGLTEYADELLEKKPQYKELFRHFFVDTTPRRRFSKQRRKFMEAVFELWSCIGLCSTVASDPKNTLDNYHEHGAWW
jgi:DNA-binding MltR family transcriptional regulator